MKEGLARVVVELAKRSWPQLWPSLIPDLLSLAEAGVCAVVEKSNNMTFKMRCLCIASLFIYLNKIKFVNVGNTLVTI